MEQRHVHGQVRPSGWRRSSSAGRTSPPRAARPWPARGSTGSSSDWTGRPSRPAPRSPSTTRSWNGWDRRRAPRRAGRAARLSGSSWSSRWRPAGRTWERGTPSGPRRTRTRPATSSAAPPSLEDGRGNLVQAESRLVAALGIDDLAIIETPDAVLVAKRDRTADLKRLVDRVDAHDKSITLFHRRVYRPWGWYESIDQGPRFQVKRLMVAPGATLSLQYHRHRAEHWVVVRGVAEVTCDGRVFRLEENHSTYVPPGRSAPTREPGHGARRDHRGPVRATTWARTTSSASRTATGGSRSSSSERRGTAALIGGAAGLRAAHRAARPSNLRRPSPAGRLGIEGDRALALQHSRGVHVHQQFPVLGGETVAEIGQQRLQTPGVVRRRSGRPRQAG